MIETHGWILGYDPKDVWNYGLVESLKFAPFASFIQKDLPDDFFADMLKEARAQHELMVKSGALDEDDHEFMDDHVLDICRMDIYFKVNPAHNNLSIDELLNKIRETGIYCTPSSIFLNGKLYTKDIEGHKVTF